MGVPLPAVAFSAMTAGTTYWPTKQRGRAKPRVLSHALHRSTYTETARNIMPYETEERVINLPLLISARDQPALLQWCNPPERKKGYWTLFRGRKSQYHYRIHCAITAWNHDHPDVKGPADLCAAGQLQARSLFEAVKRHLESDD